jgi:hypothetical protein
MQSAPRLKKRLSALCAAALLLIPVIACSAQGPATGMSAGMGGGASGSMSGGSCCPPESGLLKGTMGGVAMGLGAMLLVSLIVALWALSIFLIRKSRVRPGS